MNDLDAVMLCLKATGQLVCPLIHIQLLTRCVEKETSLLDAHNTRGEIIAFCTASSFTQSLT